MRPRVFPAEDLGDDRVGGRRDVASMRPRVFPAEDSWARSSTTPTSAGFNEAAGIPRGRRYTSGTTPGRCAYGFNEAAGIPRGRPYRAARSFFSTDGFNEAAGIPRGRPVSTRLPTSANTASMRPRVFPAEDAWVDAAKAEEALSFNEAAGIPRGRHQAAVEPARLAAASMRPRVFPAEDRPR